MSISTECLQQQKIPCYLPPAHKCAHSNRKMWSGSPQAAGVSQLHERRPGKDKTGTTIERGKSQTWRPKPNGPTLTWLSPCCISISLLTTPGWWGGTTEFTLLLTFPLPVIKHRFPSRVSPLSCRAHLANSTTPYPVACEWRRTKGEHSIFHEHKMNAEHHYLGGNRDILHMASHDSSIVLHVIRDH